MSAKPPSPSALAGGGNVERQIQRRCYVANNQLRASDDESIEERAAGSRRREAGSRRIAIGDLDPREVDANSSGSSRATSMSAIGLPTWRPLSFFSLKNQRYVQSNLTTIVICQLALTLLRLERRVFVPPFTSLTCHHLRPQLFKATPFYSPPLITPPLP